METLWLSYFPGRFVANVAIFHAAALSEQMLTQCVIEEADGSSTCSPRGWSKMIHVGVASSQLWVTVVWDSAELHWKKMLISYSSWTDPIVCLSRPALKL